MEEYLKDAICARLTACPGKIGFYYKNLNTGDAFGINENEEFLAASVIKLPLFAAISRMAAQKQADWSEKILVTDGEKLPSCGALNSFTGNVEADIRTLCSLMITISDNTATNVLIRRFGMEALNQAFREMDLFRTKLRRLLFDGEAGAAGLENTVVPAELGRLLEKIARHTFVDEETSALVEETLLKQQINHKICGRLGEDVPVAHKTGEDDGISNDVGVVYARQPFVACFLSNDTDVPMFEDRIRQISYELYLEAEKAD